MTEVKYAYLKFRDVNDKELIVRVVEAVDEGWFNKYDEGDRRKITDALKRRGWLFNGLVKGEPDNAVDLDTLI
jgi:dissimilatory sulfite reductase (desulfoviridin) alpha/beta subunit